ncbi:hypothetical protein ATCC90586_002314 [Pythium insidiosum]|nr:hypothetical protein ATCC90586_002314 [Pythium insidiosum]
MRRPNTLHVSGNGASTPQGILSVFSTLSAFNLNIELIAPGCFNVQVSYKNKWTVIEVLPLVVTTISLQLFATRYVHKRFVLPRTTRLTSHKPKLFGSTLVLMYYRFLYLTRTTLEVFKCAESMPPNDHRYMVALNTECFARGAQPYTNAYETQQVLDVYTRHVTHATRLAKLRGETYHPPLRPDSTAATTGGDASGSSGCCGAGGSGRAGAGSGAVATTCLAQEETMVELLSGIMFAGGQLGNVQDGFHVAGAQFLSFWNVLLIFASCFYFAIVLVMELLCGHPQLTTNDALEMVAHRTANLFLKKQAEASAQALLEKSRQQDTILALKEMKLRGLERKHTRRGSYVLALQPNECNGCHDEDKIYDFVHCEKPLRNVMFGDIFGNDTTSVWTARAGVSAFPDKVKLAHMKKDPTPLSVH